MRIVDWGLWTYSLPLVRRLVIGNRSISARVGAIISLVSEDGLTGYGEAAPLEGLHRETLTEAIAQLKKILPRIDAADCLEQLYPSVRFAVEMALFDLEIQRDGLSDVASGIRIPINGLVMGQDDDVGRQVERLVERGYRSVKIKVGRQKLDDDIRTVNRIKEQLAGRATVRLDANRSWGLDEAVGFCRAVSAEGIEYIEEPLRDVGRYQEYFESADMAVALDETLAKSGPDVLSKIEHVYAAVLKPSVLGGFDRTMEFVRAGRQNGVLPVLSCAFESDLSLRAIALFAAREGLVDIPMGLDTMKWFGQSLVPAGFEVTGGCVDIAQLLACRGVIDKGLLRDVE